MNSAPKTEVSMVACFFKNPVNQSHITEDKETAMVMELAMTTEKAMAMAMATAIATVTIIKEGLPLHVAAMCSAFGGAAPCLHPHGHKRKCVHHGGDTAKSICSPSRGRVPDSSPWIAFCLFFTTTVQFTEQPSVCPPTLFRRSRTLSAD